MSEKNEVVIEHLESKNEEKKESKLVWFGKGKPGRKPKEKKEENQE